MNNLYFITDNETIKNNLLEIGIKEKTSAYGTQEERQTLANFILARQRDLCRGSDMFDYLIDNLLNTSNTTIFIHGGFEVLGLINFNILTIANEKMIITKGICVPKRDTSEKRGSILINILKQLGSNLHVKKIAIFSLPEAKTFYEKNGFIEEESGTNYMIYNIEEGKSSFKSNKGGKRFIKKNSRKRRTKKNRHYKRIK